MATALEPQAEPRKMPHPSRKHIKTVLVTGANGEMGHGLIDYLAEMHVRIVAVDLHPMDEGLQAKCYRTVIGDIGDNALLESLSTGFDFQAIYHLAALLSTRAERQPPLAHRVNVNGTLNLLEIAVVQSRLQGHPIKFIFPSSIAVYGLPDLATKNKVGRVSENDHCQPRTMYGINKLYGEQLGRYYTRFYRQLDADRQEDYVDFRSLRFPGLISAHTLPTGGTSDYAPEMLHSAAQNRHYACFAREDTRIPFMAMPDAIHAITLLESAPRQNLTQQIYNIGAFDPSAKELYNIVLDFFPKAQVTFEPDWKRQAILDSWPEAVNDDAARFDWGWQPRYDLDKAFSQYLVPAVKRRYG
jgi:threonine 3-dehydrogenase